MAELRLVQLGPVNFSPATLGTREQKLLWPTVIGQRTLWVTAQPLTRLDANTNAYLTVGTADEPEAFLKAGDLDLEEDPRFRPVTGRGTLVDHTGGFLSTTVDGIYVFWEPEDRYGSTTPVVRFWATVLRDLPGYSYLPAT